MNLKLDLFITFFKLGLITFGGGYAMISQLKEIVVDKKNWINNDELLEICAIGESTPGPIAVNLSTFIGYKKANFIGSVLATLGVIMPSFIIIFLISLFLNQFMENKYVLYAFTGIKCAVAFLIIKASIEMFLTMKKTIWQNMIIFTVSILMIVFELFSINFSSILLIVLGGLIAILIMNVFRKRKEVN